MKQNTTLAKQKKYIIILAICVAALAIGAFVLSFFLKAPLVTVRNYDEDGDLVFAYITDKNGIVTKSALQNALEMGEKGEFDVTKGESDDVAYTFRAHGITVSYSPYIFEPFSLDALNGVEITNSTGTFQVQRDENSGDFIIDKAPMQLYNSSKLSSLLYQSRSMLCQDKVKNPADDLSSYGLSDDTASAKIRVFDKNGKSHTILLGNMTSDRQGYYMKHSQKPYIYIADTSVSIFLDAVFAYINPKIQPDIPQQMCGYMEKFSIQKKNERFFECEIIPEDKRNLSSDTSLHKVTYPANYSPSLDNFYDALLCLSSLSGETVMAFNVSQNEEKEALLESFGLLVPESSVEYAISGKDYKFSASRLMTDETGNAFYYVYTDYMDTIVSLSADKVPFLEYGLIDFVDMGVFRRNIKDIKSLSVKTPAETRIFEVSHDENSSAIGVTEILSGKQIDEKSFRQMFISLMGIYIAGYSDVKETQGLTKDFEFTVNTTYGENLTYHFYSLSTTRCLVSLDGENAQFYVNRSGIEKVINQIQMLMSGQEIKSEIN